ELLHGGQVRCGDVVGVGSGVDRLDPGGSGAGQAPLGEVPGQGRLLAHELISANWAPGNIVQSDGNRGTPRPAQGEDGRILDLQDERAVGSAHATHVAEVSEQPAHGIELVDQVEDHASAEGAVGAVVRPVVP